MRLPGATRQRLLASALVGAFALAACGGGDEGESGSELPPAASVEFLGRDLGGETVAAASDIESNPLPDLVLDNVSTGGKSNLKNLLPGEKPILLWMYAPH